MLGIMYRPPSANVEYFNLMLDQIERLNQMSDQMLLLGDLNFNYKLDESLCTNPIHHIEVLNNMRQIITTPTRVTNTTSTLLDVILTSDHESHSNTGVHEISVSDHYMIYTLYKANTSVSAMKHRYITYRNFTKFNVNDFKRDLTADFDFNADWADDKLNEKWDLFKQHFIETSNKHAPMVKRRLKKRVNPWMSSDIVKLMYKRDYYKKKAISADNSAQLWQLYKETRNLVNKEVKRAKKTYFKDKVDECNGDSKKLWKVLHQVTGGKNKQSPPVTLTAETFNAFFGSIGTDTVAHLHDDNSNNILWKGPKCTHKFTFAEVNDESIYKHLCKLGHDSSTDILGFDSKLLCASCDIITPFLTKLFNASIRSNHVVDDWKLSKVTPVYKGKGDKSYESNYRPISVIGHIIKILEKEVKSQVMQYLLSYKLITIDQSAYMAHHNTQTALHRVIDDWLQNMSDGILTGVCSLDIKKCFDTINHNILLMKMSYYGFQKDEVEWFSSYLTNRCQKVSCHNSLSDKEILHIGIPQGSILGPLLFLLYINDISQHVHIGSCNLYADDTLVYCTGRTIDELQGNLQECIADVNNWYDRNKLVVNASKSNSMLVCTQQRENHLNHETELNIRFANEILNQVECIDYLGIKLDSHMSWNAYVNELCQNLTGKLARFSRMRSVLPTESLMQIYNSIIQPKIDYAISVWGITSQQNIDKVQRLQNRAARIITGNFDYVNVRGIDLVKRLKWMTVNDRCTYFISLLMFKCIHGLAPDYLCNEITMHVDVAERLGRMFNVNNVYVPFSNLEIFKKAFVYKGPTIWNSLPDSMKEIHTLDSFKRNMKKFLKYGHGKSG